MINQLPRTEYSPPTTDPADLEGVDAAAGSLIGPLIDPDRLVLRYGSAILMVLLVGGLRLALMPFMGSQAILLPFILCVLGAATLGGFGPAILASVLAPILITLLFPGWLNDLIGLAWLGHVALFLVIGASVAVLMRRLQRSAGVQRAALVVMRQSQREASRSEAQLRLMADALPVLISYVDAKQRYRFNNNGYEDWFGLKSKELHGRQVQDVWGDAAYKVLRPHIETALAGSAVDREEQLPYGSGVRDVRVHLIPDVGPTKVVNGVFKLIEDISVRKRADQAVLDKLSSLSAALRAGGSGAFEWDVDADVLTWSEENLQLHGFQGGRGPRDRDAWLNCIHADDRIRVGDALSLALLEGRFAVEYRISREDTGERRWIRARGEVVSREARPDCLIGLSTDVTE